jgi:hypothetical protein
MHPRPFNAHSPGAGGSGLVQYVFRSPPRNLPIESSRRGSCAAPLSEKRSSLCKIILSIREVLLLTLQCYAQGAKSRVWMHHRLRTQHPARGSGAPVRSRRAHASSGQQISEGYLRKARGIRPVVEIDGDIGEDGVVAVRFAVDLRPRDRPSCCIGRRVSSLGKGAGVRRLVAFGRHRRDRAEIGVEGQRNAAVEPDAAAVPAKRAPSGPGTRGAIPRNPAGSRSCRHQKGSARSGRSRRHRRAWRRPQRSVRQRMPTAGRGEWCRDRADILETVKGAAGLGRELLADIDGHCRRRAGIDREEGVFGPICPHVLLLGALQTPGAIPAQGLGMVRSR